jgi:hypothetical protein
MGRLHKDARHFLKRHEDGLAARGLAVFAMRRRPLCEHGSETEAERAATLRATATGAPEIIVHDRYQRVRAAAAPRP